MKIGKLGMMKIMPITMKITISEQLPNHQLIIACDFEGIICHSLFKGNNNSETFLAFFDKLLDVQKKSILVIFLIAISLWIIALYMKVQQYMTTPKKIK